MLDLEQPSYQRLRKIYAQNTRNIVAWVGSGLSQPAGLPTWLGLRNQLMDEGSRKARTLEPKDRDNLDRNLSAISKISDSWLAFEKLKDALGATSFQAAVRDALASQGVECPEEYRLLWRLRIGGILTLNLDRFAARSFAEEHRAVMNEMTGREAPARMAVLKSHAPFIVNLHGILDDASTWVLTRDEATRLLESPGYQAFILTIFATSTVLFIGISADDITTGGILSKLRTQGLDPGQHFWITNRIDRATDDWAENAGIQVIRYTAETTHQRSLALFFDDMRRFTPTDRDEPEPRPVIISPIQASETELPAPNELANADPEVIRQKLTAEAKKILSDGSTESVEAYSDLLSRYQRAAHNAWYVSIEPPDNILFGYILSEAIGSGAFAKVYRGLSPLGESVAVKLLRPEVVQDKQMLGSFRRGVRSMRILSEKNVEGMVPYREAYELPACAIMEFIEGPNLQFAVEKKFIDPWKEGLRIISDAARIIRRGHLLPEQVLHRDIRPPNIMLKNFYPGRSDDWDVVVLDFDLSWHRGATEKSIDLKAATALGYLAPEQVQPIAHVSTRSALVDSFGLGMTMAYVFTKMHPIPGASANETWEDWIFSKIQQLQATEWRSLARRLARLIAKATRIDQSRRADFGEIVSELDRLRSAWLSPKEVEHAELWTEELLARCFGLDNYKWNSDLIQGEVSQAGGLQILLRGDEAHAKVHLHAGWASSGDYDRKNLGKFLPPKVDQFASRLRSGGWSILQRNTDKGSFNFSAEISIEALNNNSSLAIVGLSSGAQAISF
jgi:serine/threonine protein kinase